MAWQSIWATANYMSPLSTVNRRVPRPPRGRAEELSPFELVFTHLAGEGVAVHAEGAGRFGQAAVGLSEDPGDEALLEFADRIVELHAALDHLFDEPFEPIGNHASSRPVKRRNASTYFSRVFATTSSGSEGTGGCLFHLIRSR